MRKTAALLIFFLVTVAPSFAGQSIPVSQGRDIFAQAVSKYQAGDYSGAIALNEKLLKEAQLESPEVYFNLGNSYFKNGKLGMAMINYLRAERLAPRDGDIRANLGFARQAVEQYDAERTVPSGTRWLGIFSSLSSAELKWLALVVFMLTGIVCLGSLYGGLPFKRVLLLTGLALTITGYVLAGVSLRFYSMQDRAVILAKTEARFEPSTQATVYFKVPEGAEVRVQCHKEGWFKVSRPDGRTGWIPDNAAGAL